MSALSERPLFQSEFFSGAYALLAGQIARYQKQRHLAGDTSVPEETAKELLESILYTLEKAGAPLPNEAPAARLARGQAAIAAEKAQAQKLLQLVAATAPESSSDSYHHTLVSLERCLARYDETLLACRVPDWFEYPLLGSPAEGLRGLDHVTAQLQAMWEENQLLAALPVSECEALYRRIDPDYLGIPANLCEPVLCCAIARALLGKSARTLTLTDRDRAALCDLLAPLPPDALRAKLALALDAALHEWEIPSTGAVAYARAVLPQLLPRILSALPQQELRFVFP